jgi:hypothetical protein
MKRGEASKIPSQRRVRGSQVGMSTATLRHSTFQKNFWATCTIGVDDFEDFLNILRSAVTDTVF